MSFITHRQPPKKKKKVRRMKELDWFLSIYNRRIVHKSKLVLSDHPPLHSDSDNPREYKEKNYNPTT